MFSILFTVFLIIIISVVLLHYTRQLKFRTLNNVPGPKSYPLIGNLLEFGFDIIDNFTSLIRLSEQFKNTPFFKLWLGPWNLYLISTDPEFIKFILSSPNYIKKSDDYNFLKAVGGNGLLTSNGIYWQKHRKLLNSAFHWKVIEGYVSSYNDQSNILIEKLGSCVGQGDFDVHPYISNCTLDVITETAMGTSVEAQTTTGNKIVECIQEIMHIASNRAFSLWKRFDILFQFSPEFKKLQELKKYGEAYSKQLINSRKKQINNNLNEAVIRTDDMGIKKKQVFLDILLQSTIDGKPLTDEEIQEEVNTFIVAGADATAALLNFALHELSRNPEIQNKVFMEVKDIFHDDKSYEPNFEDLNELKYTELVLKETLRLYPAGPYFLRQFEDDVNYKGTIIPEGTVIVPFIYGMQRREDLFPNASKFDPDRFLTQSDTMVPFSYVPFSAGLRNCIGQNFGMCESLCVLSKIVMNFEILPADSKCDLQLAAAVVLKAPNGVH